MRQLYYIHNPDDWLPGDAELIKNKLTALGLRHDRDAAVGEGAGGAGFETIVEVVLNDPIFSGLVSSTIFEIAKVLWTKRPNNKKLPEGLPNTLDAYRLVVHVQDEDRSTIVGVDLKTDMKQIETAINIKLDEKLKGNSSRIYQNGDDWDVY